MDGIDPDSFKYCDEIFPEVSLTVICAVKACPTFYRDGRLFLSLANTTDKQAQELVNLLLLSSNITSLSFYGDISALYRNNVIHCSIGNSYTGPLPTTSVAKIMYGALANPNITELDCRVYPDILDLIEALERYPHVHLKYLYVGTITNMELKLRLMARCKKVVVADNISNKADFPEIRHLQLTSNLKITEFLADLPHLMSLDIKIDLRDLHAQAKELAKALSCHPSITSINIHLSRFPSFAGVLKARPYKSISIKGFHYDIIHTIGSQRELYKFSFEKGRTRLSSIVTSELLEALAQCPLRILQLQGVDMDRRSWKALSQLEKNGLESLLLSDYKSKGPGETKFFHSFTNLRSLDITHYSSRDRWFTMIKTNTSLQHLSIDLQGKKAQEDRNVWDKLEGPLMDNLTLRSFSYTPLDNFFWVFLAFFRCRNIYGWSPMRHVFYHITVKNNLQLLLSAQYTQTLYPSYSLLPREVLYHILWYFAS